MPEPDPDEADKRQLAWLEKGWYEGALDFASGHGRMPDNGLSPNARVLAPRALSFTCSPFGLRPGSSWRRS